MPLIPAHFATSITKRLLRNYRTPVRAASQRPHHWYRAPLLEAGAAGERLVAKYLLYYHRRVILYSKLASCRGWSARGNEGHCVVACIAGWRNWNNVKIPIFWVHKDMSISSSMTIWLIVGGLPAGSTDISSCLTRYHHRALICVGRR